MISLNDNSKIINKSFWQNGKNHIFELIGLIKCYKVNMYLKLKLHQIQTGLNIIEVVTSFTVFWQASLSNYDIVEIRA